MDERLFGKGAIRHWHPVMLASKLRDRPVAVKILNEELVLFRTPDGVGALHDRCPHRGARLSAGCLEAGSVVCPYHRWRFDRNGAGQSPVNPNMRPFARAFDASEHVGFVWVRQRGSSSPLPQIDPDTLHFVGQSVGTIKAPFFVVVDNFTEIEHSPGNHFVFAFDADGIGHVEPKVDRVGDSLHVVYSGPQRTPPWWTFAQLFGLKAGSRLVIDLSVHFSPIYWVYDYHWEDPATGRWLSKRIREYAFITPQDDRSTSVFLLFYSSLAVMAPFNPLRRLLAPMFMNRVHVEYDLDRRICENVASITRQSGFEDCQLGKFDRVLRDTRRLIGTVYNGASDAATRPTSRNAAVE
jgi:phenylpropionate dioxygenase-like ring-hydroxylating dioxygenase large terminal subunit